MNFKFIYRSVIKLKVVKLTRCDFVTKRVNGDKIRLCDLAQTAILR